MAVDWHDPHWLAAVIVILLLSVADALLTLTLLQHGAEEANPFMRPLVSGNGHWFAFWKVGLTTAGLLVLVQLSRHRLIGRIRVGVLLYLVLGLYAALIAYEWSLLQRIGVQITQVRFLSGALPLN